LGPEFAGQKLKLAEKKPAAAEEKLDKNSKNSPTKTWVRRFSSIPL